MTSSTGGDLSTQVAELEVQLSFQEDHIQKLSDALYQQQKRIDVLEQIVKDYEKKMQEIMEGVGEVYSEDAPPPHY